jgi:hypothetical protein
MKPKKRQKLCHNCEGEIDVDVIVCPFCAADLREEKPEQKRPSYNPFVRNLNDQQTMQSLYPPPYKGAEAEPQESQGAEVPAAAAEPAEDKKNNVFTPTILFTLGVQLFILGLLMLLFSHKGTVILKWDARFWFLYVFASIPFLVFGYKALSKL